MSNKNILPLLFICFISFALCILSSGCDEPQEEGVVFIYNAGSEQVAVDTSTFDMNTAELDDQFNSLTEDRSLTEDISDQNLDFSTGSDSQTQDSGLPNDLSTEDGEDQGQNQGQDLGQNLDLVDMGSSLSEVAFVESYWSATHNSYEGDERGSVIDQLNGGVRALEYDIHDNDFSRFGYRLGHFQFGDAVAYGNGNPNNDSLGDWLDVINTWSNNNLGHAPLILTIDLKDNLMDNRSYAEGNLAHLNQVLLSHLDRIWLPNMGLNAVNLARDHILCILSGDAETRRGYLHDVGRSPALNINQRGYLLEVHDSGSGYLWYWSAIITANDVLWKRHGRYDSGQRPVVLINQSNQVIEVHQSESRDRLWASTGTLSGQGELSLNSARDFSDGTWPSLQWTNEAQGEFSLRYVRSSRQYERIGTANFTQARINWNGERELSSSENLHERSVSQYQEGQYQVSTLRGLSDYPENTLWLSISAYGVTVAEMPITYEQLCHVEWQRNEHNDPLLGLQSFGAVPSGDYSRLPLDVKTSKVIRAWEYSGRNASIIVPQIPSVDYPFRNDYQDFISELGVVE